MYKCSYFRYGFQYIIRIFIFAHTRRFCPLPIIVCRDAPQIIFYDNPQFYMTLYKKEPPTETYNNQILVSY